MHYVYVLVSHFNGRRYVGLTNDPDRRLREHNAGHNRSTAPYAPFSMFVVRKHETLTEARNSERYLKIRVPLSG